MEVLPEAFFNRRPQQEKARDEMGAEIYRLIGQLKVELEWLKKKSQPPLTLLAKSILRAS